MNHGLHQVVLVLHVACTTAWAGPKLSIPRRLRTALAAGGDAAKEGIETIARDLRTATIFGLLTLLSGIGLIFLRGGFADVSPRVHASLALVVVALALGWLVVTPAVSRIQAAIVASAKSEVRADRAKIAAVLGVEQTIWLAVLTLMLWRVG